MAVVDLMLDPQLNPLLLSAAVIAMFALVWGGIRTLRNDRQRGVLMLVAALVLLGNLLIWSV
ncbi:hypothetical protein [Sphingomonas xinjiangensis]|uniref:Uncharacterized protein n=1 Tax=Sphingomonas xinjiangensis TaxID=643568 RepID=A0A840YMQ7_9SPHN|nr:hypothetical protein [Sphingomonas xinjiangensis]MBB5708871.1 hypothetical protein [Sphingomonas xinjiangensis]